MARALSIIFSLRRPSFRKTRFFSQKLYLDVCGKQDIRHNPKMFFLVENLGLPTLTISFVYVNMGPYEAILLKRYSSVSFILL